MKARQQAPTRNTKNAVDRLQNIKIRQCPLATSVLRNYCLNCCVEQSYNIIISVMIDFIQRCSPLSSRLIALLSHVILND